jgi:predicted site-specific integrase-resolvase
MRFTIDPAGTTGPQSQEVASYNKQRSAYGYARVSTDGQSLAAQLTELKEARCEKIFQEKISGTRSHRKQLAKLMALLAGQTEKSGRTPGKFRR